MRTIVKKTELINMDSHLRIQLLVYFILSTWFILSFVYYCGLLFKIPYFFKFIDFFDILYNVKIMVIMFITTVVTVVIYIYSKTIDVSEETISVLIYSNSICIITLAFIVYFCHEINKHSVVLTIITSASLALSFVTFVLRDKKNKQRNVFAGLTFIGLIGLNFAIGLNNYKFLEKNMEPTIFSIKALHGNSYKVKILANLEKGILAKNIDTNEFSIINWNNITEVNLQK